jgi:hypothetical protein
VHVLIIYPGDYMCPWPNQLETFLRKAYPQCKHIDIYNLGHHATDHEWLLGHVYELFNREGGARGGKRLGDVVDLVLVDYSVNDGQRFNTALNRLHLQNNENNYQGRLSSLVEYFVRFVLKRPNKPALVYVESGASQDFEDSFKGHYDTLKRYGIPMVSPRHVFSYPDNPCFLFFFQRPDNLRSVSGYYPAEGNFSTKPVIVSSKSHLPLREGMPKYNSKGELRSHKFLSCWGYGTHPFHSAHTVIAQSILYFFQVVPKGSLIMTLNAKEQHTTCDENVKTNVKMSTYAEVFEPILNPIAACPKGPLTSYDSGSMYLSSISLDTMGPNQNTAWELVEDRQNKYGFIISDYSNHSVVKNILKFKLRISAIPSIAIEYMYTYENAGKVELILEQNEVGGATVSSSNTAVDKSNPNDAITITTSSSLTLDTFEKGSHALTTVFKMTPVGFRPGWVTLVVKLSELTRAELEERKGCKVKIETVSSC